MDRTVERRKQKELRDRLMDYYSPEEIKRIKRRNKIRYRKMFLVVCVAQTIVLLIFKLLGI